jgi:hypothetical protein
MRNKIFIGLILAGLIAAALGFYMFNKKVPGLESVRADFNLTANELFDAFEENEQAAMAKFENKVLAVTGKIINIKHGEVSSNVILHADNAMAGGINCSFSSLNKQLIEDQTITIKGRCQGFLMDVVLNNCTIDDEI